MDFFNGDPIQSSILDEFYLHLDHSFLQIQKPIACPFNSSLKCTVGVHPVFDGCDSGITIDWSLSAGTRVPRAQRTGCASRNKRDHSGEELFTNQLLLPVHLLPLEELRKYHLRHNHKPSKKTIDELAQTLKSHRQKEDKRFINKWLLEELSE